MRFRLELLSIWLTPALGLATLVAGPSSPARRSWLKDFEQAQAVAERLNQPLLIHFFADWCQPCQRMEREVLSSTELRERLQDQFVAVRLNADEHLDLVERFEVNSLPCDIVVAPDGTPLSRWEGFQPKQEYLAHLERVEAAWRRSQEQRLVKSSGPGHSTVRPGQTQTTPPKARESATLDTRKPRNEISGPIHSNKIGNRDSNARHARSPVESAPQAAASGMVGLQGFSPVALWDRREWVRGQQEYAWSFKDVPYWMASQEELRRFQLDPERFAPGLLGCDPVILLEMDRAVAGSIRFGAYYANELFLFQSAASRKKFRESPMRYARTRHVLRAEEIEWSPRR